MLPPSSSSALLPVPFPGFFCQPVLQCSSLAWSASWKGPASWAQCLAWSCQAAFVSCGCGSIQLSDASEVDSAHWRGPGRRCCVILCLPYTWHISPPPKPKPSSTCRSTLRVDLLASRSCRCKNNYLLNLYEKRSTRMIFARLNEPERNPDEQLCPRSCFAFAAWLRLSNSTTQYLCAQTKSSHAVLQHA